MKEKIETSDEFVDSRVAYGNNDVTEVVWASM
jgi:hypothetical protein